MEERRLIKKTGLYLIGNLSSKILSFLLIPLYAFYVSVTDLGNYDFSQTIMLILVPFIFVAIWEAILKFLIISKEKKDIIITTSIMFVFFVMFFLITLTIIITSIFSIKIENLNYIIIMICSYSLSCIWQYYARGLGENKSFVLASVCGTLVNFASNLVLLCIFKLGIYSLYLSYILGQTIIFIILENKLHCLRKIKRQNFDKKILKDMLLFSTPLVLNLISMWFISGFGRAIVNKTLGAEMGGLYAFSNKFGVVINVLGSVVSMALIEESVIKSKDDDLGSYFTVTIQKLFQIFQSIILIAVPFIVIFYKFINETDYADSITVFPYFLLYAMLMTMATNVGAIFQAVEKTKYIFITTVIGALFTISISSVLVVKIGIEGVAIGQIVGALTMLISRFVVSGKFVKIDIKFNVIIYMGLYYVISAILCIRFGLFITILIMFINLGVITYVNRKDIKKVISFLMLKLNVNTRWREE